MNLCKKLLLLLSILVSFEIAAAGYMSGPGPLFSFKQMGFDNNGDGATVWLVPSDRFPVIQVSTYSFETDSWTTPLSISNPELPAFDPVLIVGPTGYSMGNVIVLWVQPNPEAGVFSLYAAMHPPGGDWMPAVQISSDTEDLTPGFDLRINGMGNVLAVWNSYDENGCINCRSASAQCPNETQVLELIAKGLSTPWNPPKTITQYPVNGSKRKK